MLCTQVRLYHSLCLVCNYFIQEMWANAHETRDGMSLISCAGCLDLSPVISANIYSLSVRRSLKSRKIHLNPAIIRFQGCSRSSMLVPLERWSAVPVIISSKSVSVCNRSHARRANGGKIMISLVVPLYHALIRGESLHPAARDLVAENLKLFAIIS